MAGIDLSGLPTGLRKQFEAAMAAPPAGETDTAGAPPAPAASESAPSSEHAPAQEPGKTATPSTDAPASSPTAQMLAEEGSWKAKHDAMYGRLSAQIGELKQQVASLTQQSEAVRQENAQLREALRSAPSTPAGASPAPAPTADITDDYIRSVVPANVLEDYGMDYWRANLTALRAMAPQSAPAAKTPDENARLRSIEAELRRQKEEDFRRTLTGMVPDWRQVNDSSAWMAFLGEVDRVTGYLNEELLRDAYGSLDAVRVAALFDRFKANAGAPKRTIDDHVSLPSRGGGGAPVSPNPTMTLAEWTAEMNKIVQTGMPPAQADKRMKELRAIYEQGLADVPKGGTPPSGVW